MTQPNEKLRDLVTQAEAGSRVAFEELLDRFKARVDSWARIRVGEDLRRKVGLQDIVQETLLRALEAAERFEWRGEDAFANWLCRICENVIHDNAKRLRRRPEVAIDSDPHVDAVSPSRAYRRGERFERLENAVRELPDDYREVIVLSRLQGVPLKEVARRMNRSPNAISHLIMRALDRLRKLMGDTDSLRLPERRLQEEPTEDG